MIKCKLCKKGINYNLYKDFSSFDSFYKSKYWYHKNCYLQQQVSKRRETWDEGQPFEQFESDTETEIKNIEVKHNITNLIVNNYQLSFYSKGLFKKISTIFDGTYENLQCPISPIDFYELWCEQLPTLKQNHYFLNKKGINDERLVLYDIAIVLSKYSQWMEEKQNKIDNQKLLQQRINEQDYQQNILNTMCDNHNKTQNDISTILNEI